MKYHYRISIPARIRRHKRLIRFFSLSIIFIVICVAVFIFYLVKLQAPGNMPLGGIDSSFYQPLKTFKTKYYSFEAEKEWNFVPKESSQSVFVYRQSHKNIVMSDLKIYVNSLPGDLLLTNILPVKPAGDQFNTDQISPHCKEALPKNYLLTNRNPKNVVFKGVSFKCWSDGTLPVVGTGLYGGSYQSELEGKKSGKNKFFLIYNDRQYNQTLFKFQNIVESFKAL